MKGFNVYMTEDEYQAITEIYSEHTTQLEASSPEYGESVENTTESAFKFIEKCSWARAKSNN